MRYLYLRQACLEDFSGNSVIQTLCGPSGTLLCFQGKSEGIFHLPITSGTTVSEHDLNMSACPGAFWLLHQASLSCFLHQATVKTWPCLSELECANRTRL